jgi:hypothetical protein
MHEFTPSVFSCLKVAVKAAGVNLQGGRPSESAAGQIGHTRGKLKVDKNTGQDYTK